MVKKLSAKPPDHYATGAPHQTPQLGPTSATLQLTIQMWERRFCVGGLGISQSLLYNVGVTTRIVIRFSDTVQLSSQFNSHSHCATLLLLEFHDFDE